MGVQTLGSKTTSLEDQEIPAKATSAFAGKVQRKSLPMIKLPGHMKVEQEKFKSDSAAFHKPPVIPVTTQAQPTG